MKSIVKYSYAAPSWSEWNGGDPGYEDLEFLVPDDEVIQTFVEGDYLDDEELEEFLELTPEQQLNEILDWAWEHLDSLIEDDEPDDDYYYERMIEEQLLGE